MNTKDNPIKTMNAAWDVRIGNKSSRSYRMIPGQ